MKAEKIPESKGKGIRVFYAGENEGIDLEDIVAEEEEKKKREDVRATREEDLNEKSKVAKSARRRPKAKYEEPFKQRGRVHRWTDDKIRRTFGVMAKPFKSLRGNIIWLLKEHGQLTAKQMEEHIPGKTASSITSVLSGMWKRMEPMDLLHRFPDDKTKGYVYELTPKTEKVTVNRLLELMDRRKGPKIKKREQPLSPPPPEVDLVEQGPPTGTPISLPTKVEIEITINGKIEHILRFGG
jgi:hypothetical protein